MVGLLALPHRGVELARPPVFLQCAARALRRRATARRRRRRRGLGLQPDRVADLHQPGRLVSDVSVT